MNLQELKSDSFKIDKTKSISIKKMDLLLEDRCQSENGS